MPVKARPPTPRGGPASLREQGPAPEPSGLEHGGRPITSRSNPEFRFLLELAESSRARRQAGLTLLDGWHLIEAALQAGLRLERLIVSEAAAPLPAAEAATAGVPRRVLSEALVRALSPVKTPTGWLALVEIPRPAAQDCRCAVLLEDIQDPGNLGAILRSAAAAGVEAAYLSQGCADAWSPKTLRGGQGAQFRLAIHERADLPAVAGRYRGRAYAAVLGAKASLYDLDLRGAVAFAFGNEGAGLAEALSARCRPFTIPMPGAVESLNVASAAAVCLFERVRQLRGC